MFNYGFLKRQRYKELIAKYASIFIENMHLYVIKN